MQDSGAEPGDAGTTASSRNAGSMHSPSGSAEQHPDLMGALEAIELVVRAQLLGHREELVGHRTTGV